MANTMKKTTKSAVKTEEPVKEEVVEISDTVENIENDVVKETVKETAEEVKKAAPKKYEATDGIPCRSITSGGLYMSGIKSRIMYEWADDGDITDVEYQDIVAAIRSSASYITKPRFIIEDADIIKQFPQLDKIYASMYSIKDLRDVLTKTTPNEMRTVILSLPEGAKDSIKNMASQMISKGTLDSVKKIKILDEIFNTELVLMTGLYN